MVCFLIFCRNMLCSVLGFGWVVMSVLIFDCIMVVDVVMFIKVVCSLVRDMFGMVVFFNE